MPIRSFAFAVLAILLLARNAQAFFDPPSISPASPVAGETVSARIRGGVCDAIAERAGYPQITRSGNSIRIVEYGHHYETASELCVYDVSTVTTPIGALASGSYMLTVDLVYDDLALGPTVMNIGVVSFTVVGAPVPPVPLPAFDGYGRTVLLLLVAGLGISTLRPRRAGQAHRSQ